MTHATAAPLSLHDLQAEADTRSLQIDRVGVSGLTYPTTVLDRSDGLQQASGRRVLTRDTLPCRRMTIIAVWKTWSGRSALASSTIRESAGPRSG